MPNKAIASGAGAFGGSGLGGAVAIIIIALWWPNADATVASALTTVCATVLAVPTAFFGAYLSKMEEGVPPS